MSQLIKAIGVLVLLALLVPGAAAETKKDARGQRASGHNVTSKRHITCYGNYTSLHNHAQQLCCKAISNYIRSGGDNRHLAIYNSLALICGGGND